MATILDLTNTTAPATTDELLIETTGGSRALAMSVLDDRYTPRLTTIITSGGSRTLALTDADALIRFTTTATITVPPNSSVAFPIGSSVIVERSTTSAVGFAAGVGVTLRAYPGPNLAGQYATAAAIKVATNEWVLTGALST